MNNDTPMVKLMLIDDDKLYVEQLSQRLSSWENLEFIAFTDIVSSMSQKSEVHPNIILIDHFLNEVDGASYISNLRFDYPKATLCLLSAQNDVEVFADAARNGVDLYLKKDRHILNQLERLILEVNPKEPDANKEVKKSKFSRKPSKTVTSTTVAPDVNESLAFIIEDEEMFAKMIDYKLRKLINIETELYMDADDAVLSLKNYPKLVILDYELGYMNGIQVFESIKKVSPKTEVIMITGQRSLDVAIQLHNMGVRNYIVKNDRWEENLEIVLKSVLKLS